MPVASMQYKVVHLQELVGREAADRMVDRVREHEFPGNVAPADLQNTAALSNTLENHS